MSDPRSGRGQTDRKPCQSPNCRVVSRVWILLVVTGIPPLNLPAAAYNGCLYGSVIAPARSVAADWFDVGSEN
jgi:hypothetical protein